MDETSDTDTTDLVMSDTGVRGDSLHTLIYYPRNSTVKHVVIGLMDVRASDGVRVSYDFERDGWVICQPTVLSWACDDPVCDEGWKEAAFIPSWQFEKLQKENEESRRRSVGGKMKRATAEPRVDVSFVLNKVNINLPPWASFTPEMHAEVQAIARKFLYQPMTHTTRAAIERTVQSRVHDWFVSGLILEEEETVLDEKSAKLEGK